MDATQATQLFLGAVVGRIKVGPYEVEKRVAHVAYARNGNQHNPSVTYSWTVFRSGRRLSAPLPYRRDALDFIREFETIEK